MAIDRADLIADYQRVAEQLEKTPTLNEYNQHGQYSQQPIYNKWGSFKDFKEAAGFDRKQFWYDDEELLNDLRRVADKIGRSPPVEKYREHGEHDHKTLEARFGAWSDVLQEAGLEPTDHSQHFEQSENPYGEHTNYVEVECDCCGETTEKRSRQVRRYDKSYCDMECLSNAYAEQTGEEAVAWEGGNVAVECEICGTVSKVVPAKASKTRFCSQECMLEWRSEFLSGDGHPRWNPDSEETYYGKNWYPQRRKALERDDRMCQLCGKGHTQHIRDHDRAHDVHHIIPFKHFDDYREANRLENLITLCATCHQAVEHGEVSIPTTRWHRVEAVKLACEAESHTPLFQ